MAFEVPKSVRQIGESKGNRKIYIEDYVISFAKQLARRSDGKEVAGVLLGKSQAKKREKYIFISGMVAVRNFADRSGQQFSHNMWTDIYTDIKENFTDLDILGWYYSKAEVPVACNEMLRGIHGKNFAGTDKLLFIYDETENEEGFFLSTAGVMERQKGFYIYYEKNVEMRDYMVEYQKEKTSFENVEDTATQNIRAVLQAKKGLPGAPENPVTMEGKKEGRYSIGLGAVVVAFAILLGVVALQNQNSFRQVEDQISNIRETFNRDTGEKPSKTEVETLGGNLAVTGTAATAVTSQAVSSDIATAEESAAPAAVSPEPAATVQTPAPQPTLKPTPKRTSKPTPKPTRKPTAKPTGKRVQAPVFWYYVVKKGDTLSRIAQKYYLTVGYVQKIKEYNGLKSEDEIVEGQRLKMPN